MELSFVRSCGNLNFPLNRVAVSLIVLGQSLSDVGSAEPYDRIVGSIVVRLTPKHFNSDDTFAKRVIEAGEAVLDDVVKQILALADSFEKGRCPKCLPATLRLGDEAETGSGSSSELC